MPNDPTVRRPYDPHTGRFVAHQFPTPKSPCAIPDCERFAAARGWCDMHWARWRKHGDPLITRTPTLILGTPEERFWPKVDKTETCWLFASSLDGNGYGRFGSMLAHHFLVGKPPKGFEWDHLCRVHNCVRPEHLELVTHRENMRRGVIATKTVCKNGHPFDSANTYITSAGHRQCRACKDIRIRAWAAINRPPKTHRPKPSGAASRNMFST